MKTNKFFAAILLIATVCFAACNQNKPTPPNVGPGTNPQKPDDTTTVTPQPAGNVITIAQALEILSKQEAKWESPETYEIEGTMTQLLTKAADVPDTYSNINFVMADNGSEIKCFYTNYLNNAAFTSADQIPNVNARLVVVGKLKNYAKGEEITPEITNGYIKEIKDAGQPAQVKDVTVAEAIEIVNGLKAGGQTTDQYRLKGVTVTQVLTNSADIPGKYTNINMVVKDATGSIQCYYTNYLENKPFTSADQIPAVGTELTVVGPLKSYAKGDNVTPEVYEGYIEEIIKAGEGPVDAGQISIVQALEIINGLADGASTTEIYTISGEVSEVITTPENVTKYGNVDFWMQDAEGNKIEAFRTTEPNGGKVTTAPEVGATVTVKGVLTKYVKNGEVIPEINKGEFVK